MTENVDKKYRLHWVDPRTGKASHTKDLPSGVKIGSLCRLRQNSMTAFDHRDVSLQLFSNELGYRKIKLTEVTPDPLELTLGNDHDWTWVAHTELKSGIDETSNTLVYTWHQVLYPKVGGLGGLPPHLPGFSYGVRSLADGGLLHTERFLLRERKEDNWGGEGGWMLGVLPGPVLVAEPPATPHPWLDKWEEWRRQYFQWFPVLWTKEGRRVQFIEATTGKRLSELIIPMGFAQCRWVPSQNAIYLLGRQKNQIVCMVYDYPLHKPCLLILAWSIGVALFFGCVQACLGLKRKRPA
jgi:hypothetical protein